VDSLDTSVTFVFYLYDTISDALGVIVVLVMDGPLSGFPTTIGVSWASSV
jgi:hypothetical protein